MTIDNAAVSLFSNNNKNWIVCDDVRHMGAFPFDAKIKTAQLKIELGPMYYM